MDVNVVSGQIVDSAVQIHRTFGPGLLESAYQWFMAVELRSREFTVRTNVAVPLEYKGVRVPCAYRMDMVVEDAVVVELKAIKALLPVHSAQLLSYMKLRQYRVGLLINFHEARLVDGLQRLML